MGDTATTSIQPDDRKDNGIIIYLQESSNTRAFESSNNRVHEIQFQKVTGWIDEAIGRRTHNYERLQETISIFGSRGSGKTSFLLSLINKYRNENHRVAVIDIIDPTLIEQKGHIFLTIISQIKSMVDARLKSCECNPNDPTFCYKQMWDEKLKALAHGLPSIDGVGQPKEDNWQDPEYIMQKGLRAVLSAKELEKHFGEFVEISLEILKKEIFLLMLDDIDVDFRKGWPVLESLRKYLTTPKIITLLSGDYNLFTKAVRKQQWKNFGKELLINEGECLWKMNEYNDLVTEMESQYLQKVLKPQRRINLNTLWEKHQLEVKMFVSPKAGTPEEEITKYYSDILCKYGISNMTEARAFYSFLMNQSLRTQIQFLSNDRYTKSEQYKIITQIDIVEPFLSSLYEKNVNIELANNLPEQFNAITLEFLLREKMLSEAYQLQPTVSDVNINTSLLALSLLFSEKVKKNPFLVFDYIIKIGYTSNLIDTLGYRNTGNKELSSSLAPSIEGLCEHAEMYQDNVLRNIAGNITAYLTAYLDTDKNSEQEYWSGIIRLYGLALKAKSSKQETGKRIDSVANGRNNFERALVFFPLSISRPSYKNASTSSYSLFTLLGTIGEFLKLEDVEEVRNHVKKLSQVRSYPMPNFERLNTAYEGNNEMRGLGSGEDTELAELIINWKQQFLNNKIAIPPYLIGKVVTRFYYALRAIEDKDKSKSLGEAIHYRVIAFLHAVLLEDAREYLTDISNFDHNNTNFSTNGFIGNIKKIKELSNTVTADNNSNEINIMEKLLFSRWMLSCPLLLLYLNMKTLGKIDSSRNNRGQPENIKETYFKWFITYNDSELKRNIQERIFDKSVYHLLCQVDVPESLSKGSKLPAFSGDKSMRNLKNMIEILSKADSMSYDVIMHEDIETIKNKYLDKVFSRIEANSLNFFRKNINENNELKASWMSKSRPKNIH